MTGVLVTGGTGKTGAALAELLRARGVAVRVGSRRPAAGDPDTVRFDWDDAATHPAALRGMDRVFLVLPPSVIDPIPVVGPFLSEVERAGVRRVVLLGSAIRFPDTPGRAELEDQVREHPGWVVLRASGFMQNFLPPHPVGKAVTARGEILTSSGSSRVGWIDARDVASAAGALLGDLQRDVESEYTLTGPEALSYTDAARAITAEIDRPVRVVEVDVEDVAASYLQAGVPEPWASRLAGAEIDSGNGAEQVTTAVLDLTGRPPRTLSDFVRAHASDWARLE